jgi:hypothetical protein
MRPGMIRSENGVKPRLLSHRILMPIVGIFIRLFASKYVIGNKQIGKAMINLTISGSEKQTLENFDMLAMANA